MNERIRELALQAGYVPLEPRAFADDLQDIFLKKFAELIATDVINKAERYGLGCDAIEQLKEDFGVKE